MAEHILVDVNNDITIEAVTMYSSIFSGRCKLKEQNSQKHSKGNCTVVISLCKPN